MAREESPDVMQLFLKYLEGKMVGAASPDMLCGPECFVGPEVGEDGAPDHALLYRGGVISIIEAKASELLSRGFGPYPHVNLTTEHALIVTRALATLHARAMVTEATSENKVQGKALAGSTPVAESTSPSEDTVGGEDGDPAEEKEEQSSQHRIAEAGCVKDRWTAQVSQLHIVESNLSILVDALQNLGSNQRTVRRLEALRSDLPTLTQFLQFASAMQSCRIPSVGPVQVTDVWVPIGEEDEEVVAIRLRGGKALDAPPLRDAAWVWLTLLGGETLRDRYMELCDEYCNSFNKALLRLEAANQVEEMSYFDVMRDLGENFLHAFITVLHKFVVSGSWYFDRQLHTEEGMQALVEVISFLVDNGIVGSIFVI
ncbi:uncharacterized protein LOC125030970 isoform X1 [Penaeus chinensis]|uniref:uncharacterized protein LOC125030970 isoform X1 n=2 Tax=Penaeus chinensis TaxID=139456 RepID=UPI001FB835E2|nr:uncharacterized protein LOC125030970 isoform X1 [Penaeus chinensis]XP_047477353.1 uncharacterized protein LOC125030970 isoform X1 [Penaeus chinensis]